MDEKAAQNVEQVVEKGWHDIVSQVTAVLDYKLFELDGHGVSVAKLITGFALLFVGYIISGRAAKAVDDRLLVRLPHLDVSLRYTFRRLIFYFFFFITTLFTLRALNVPITIFTVVGGALAVGIGFGSQNLVNNFISGILVMVERPIRVGDFVEVDGVSGNVQNIGIRSTAVLTGTNAIVTIPNTAFIEKNLTNWTQNASVNAKVVIGVGYDSDPLLVKKVLLQSLEGVDGVLSHPPAAVNFLDFGDNALLFDVVFNIPSAMYGVRKRIESDIRFNLNDLLVKNKISVPYPQRDIHLDIANPVSVKVL